MHAVVIQAGDVCETTPDQIFEHTRPVCIGSSCHRNLVIACHMQEYEKRLLAKDHEIKVAQANARELQKRLSLANAELANSSRVATPEPAPAQGMLITCSCKYHNISAHLQELVSMSACQR